MTLPSESDVEVIQRDSPATKPPTTGKMIQSLGTRSPQSLGDSEPLPQLNTRDDDDNDRDNDRDDDDDDNVFDDIGDKVKDVGDDLHDDVHDAFDDGVGNVKPGMITVGLLASVAVALTVM